MPYVEESRDFMSTWMSITNYESNCSVIQINTRGTNTPFSTGQEWRPDRRIQTGLNREQTAPGPHLYLAENSGKTMLPSSSSISAYGRGVTFGFNAT